MVQLWWLLLPAFCVGCLACLGCAGGTAGNGSEPRSVSVPMRTADGRPRTQERADERLRMVERQIAARDVSDPRVLEALRNVPRHWFVPEESAYDAYADSPLPIGGGQTISQPYIVALMTAALRLDAGARVLEIGTGSGYQAAVLSELCAEVYTIEIVPELARSAQRTFAERGYANVIAREGDGFRGWPEAAPFDAVIVTAAPDRIPEPLIEQLKVGGRLVIPVGDGPHDQRLWAVTKEPGGSLRHELLAPVRFVPMTGVVDDG